MRKLDVNEHWRFFSNVYKRAVQLQSSFTLIIRIGDIVHGTCVITAPYSIITYESELDQYYLECFVTHCFV